MCFALLAKFLSKNLQPARDALGLDVFDGAAGGARELGLALQQPRVKGSRRRERPHHPLHITNCTCVSRKSSKVSSAA